MPLQDRNLLLCGQVCYFCCDQGALSRNWQAYSLVFAVQWLSPRIWCVYLQGLAEHRDELGAPLCPCRHYDDKVAEAKQGFWNCPCVPMRERKVSIMLTACHQM